jgi:rubrerythrin
MKNCEHEKQYTALLSNPPKYVWVCIKCGENGKEDDQ